MAVMDTLFDRSRVDRITTEAREVEIGRTLLTLIAGLLFAVGWIAAKTVGVIWLALAWSATAVRLGWSEARMKTPPAP